MMAAVPVPLLPACFRKDLSQVNSALHTAVSVWLKKHGKNARPKLSTQQKSQLQECFHLMDTDGGGSIDADELGNALGLLGITLSKKDIEAMLLEVDESGDPGDLGYPEFVAIMTSTLAKMAEEDNQAKEGQVSFELMATAYRRKRLLESLLEGDQEVQNQIEIMQERKLQKKIDDLAAGVNRAIAAEELKALSPRNLTPRSRLRVLSKHSVVSEILRNLDPSERRVLQTVAQLQGRFELEAGMPRSSYRSTVSNQAVKAVGPLLCHLPLTLPVGSKTQFSPHAIASATHHDLQQQDFLASVRMVPRLKNLSHLQDTSDAVCPHPNFIPALPSASCPPRHHPTSVWDEVSPPPISPMPLPSRNYSYSPVDSFLLQMPGAFNLNFDICSNIHMPPYAHVNSSIHGPPPSPGPSIPTPEPPVVAMPIPHRSLQQPFHRRSPSPNPAPFPMLSPLSHAPQVPLSGHQRSQSMLPPYPPPHHPYTSPTPVPHPPARSSLPVQHSPNQHHQPISHQHQHPMPVLGSAEQANLQRQQHTSSTIWCSDAGPAAPPAATSSTTTTVAADHIHEPDGSVKSKVSSPKAPHQSPHETLHAGARVLPLYMPWGRVVHNKEGFVDGGHRASMGTVLSQLQRSQSTSLDLSLKRFLITTSRGPETSSEDTRRARAHGVATAAFEAASNRRAAVARSLLDIAPPVATPTTSVPPIPQQPARGFISKPL